MKSLHRFLALVSVLLLVGSVIPGHGNSPLAASGRLPAERVYPNDDDADEADDTDEEPESPAKKPSGRFSREKHPPRLKGTPEKTPSAPPAFPPETPATRPGTPQPGAPQPAAPRSAPERSAQHPRLPLERIGRLMVGDGGMCTAALVGPSWVLTAAHCLFGEDNKPSPARYFVRFSPAGAPLGRVAARSESRIGSRFDPASFLERSDIDGEDWALVRLAEPLGCTVGWFPVVAPDSRTLQALETRNSQESFSFVSVIGKARTYSGCKIIASWPDHTFAHVCGSREGDSGSPDLWQGPQGWSIIGLESAEADLPERKGVDLSVGSAAFVTAVNATTATPPCP